MKIISWNVNGIKSTFKSGDLQDLVKNESPDILCIQEIKTEEVPSLEGYILYSYPSSKKSNLYGTAIYTKIEPISVNKGIGDEEFDSEGRVINFEFENFNLYDVYVPSGAKDEEHLNRKYRFYDEFTKLFKKSKKPVIVCGGFNRIASEIDAKRPELMKNKSGFIPEEQEWFKEILDDYVDAFREFHPEGDNYSWFANKNLRADNKGLSYILGIINKLNGDNLWEYVQIAEAGLTKETSVRDVEAVVVTVLQRIGMNKMIFQLKTLKTG